MTGEEPSRAPAPSALPRASALDVARPRPQLVREHWADLAGVWRFDHDDAELGEREHWYHPDHRLGRDIVVPFPPESPASGIADDGFHDVVWYQREVPWEAVLAAGLDARHPRLHLRFGAVDYRATVWVNGQRVGSHEGGHTPFGFDVTELLVPGAGQLVTVRAEDRAADVEQPRGKQDWREQAHVIWYRRTTGIWQPVWLEATSEQSVEQIHCTPDIARAEIATEIRLAKPPQPGTRVRLEFHLGEERIAEATAEVRTQRSTTVAAVPRLRNGQDRDELLWTTDAPNLVDVTVSIVEPDGVVGDRVASYLGIRTTTVGEGWFLLNDRPCPIRSVLSQGYWPESHLAAPREAALREEVELILALGFNSARIHQKIEDPRMLYWADRLGLLLWAEAPAAYEFSTTAVERLTREWLEALDRDRSHPSIVTWVPMNESWGIQDVATMPTQQAFSRALVELTRAIDPTRPVISNDGWEHLESDILSVHDYEHEPETMRARYLDDGARTALRTGIGPAGRPMVLTDHLRSDAPLMLTEFGGIEYVVDREHASDDSWGYSTAASTGELRTRLANLFAALQQSRVLAGTCYTQLTDTMQEANGLLTEHREPKLPLDVLRAIITGGA